MNTLNERSQSIELGVSDEHQIMNCDSSYANENIFTRYPSFKRFNILFINIGNTYCFKFNLDKEPLYSISPKYLRGLFVFLFYLTISIAFIVLLCFMWPLLILPYLCLVGLAFVSFLKAFLLNPGIILNSSLNKDDSSRVYCSECRLFIDKEDSSHHCKECNVCIRGYDHHCGVIGKCIGRNNKRWFLSMVFSAGLLYMLSIMGVVLFVIFTIHKVKKPWTI